MPNLSALSRGTQLLAGAGVLLLLVTFLEWQSVDVGPFTVGQNAWNGFWGVAMGLLLIVLLAWVIARILDVRLPVEVPEGLVTVGLGALVLVTALLKNLTDDYSTIWSYLGVLLAAGVAAGAWLRYAESGGTVESLRASMPTRETAASPAAAPASSTTDAEPAPGASGGPAGAPSTPPPTATMPETPSEPAAAPPPPPAAEREPERDERSPDAPPGTSGQS